MLGGSFIIAGMKNAIKVIGKTARGVGKIASKAGTRLKGTGFYKKVSGTIDRVGTRMMKNVKSKRWWGRAVRVIRSSKSMLGVVGKVGAALKKSGGLLGLFGRGLSIFNTDFRSPKEFRKEMEAKEKMVANLRSKRAELIKKEVEAQAELKAPVEVEGLETSEEKLNEIARHLSQMKKSLSEVRATSFSSSSNIKGFESYQVKANQQLADAINHGTDANMKTIVGGLEDVKDQNSAIAMNSTESIIGELGSKIDAIEEQRQEEEEFRRKNDWKRKFLNAVLFLADWILNFPFKIAMLAIKLGAVLFAALGIWSLKYIKPIASMIWALKNGLGSVVGAIVGLKLIEFGSWLLSKIGVLIKWVISSLMDMYYNLLIWMSNQFAKLPFIGKYFDSVTSGIKAAHSVVTGGIDKLYDTLIGAIDYVKTSAAEEAASLLDNLKDLYNSANSEDKPNINVSGEDLQNKSKDDLANKAGNESASTANDPNISTADANSTDSKDGDGGGVLGRVGSFIKDTTTSAMSEGERLVETNDIQGKIEVTRETVKEVGQKVMDKSKAFIETNQIKEKLAKSADKTSEYMEVLNSKIDSLNESVKQTAYGKDSGGGGKETHVNKGDKILFKESGNQYQNLVQKS